ncbi:MAG: hypothetical protein IPP33_06160 [Flavobacteriales bacterium]|nr:hypothetical protein [Flavobacteriales bacterium]
MRTVSFGAARGTRPPGTIIADRDIGCLVPYSEPLVLAANAEKGAIADC